PSQAVVPRAGPVGVRATRARADINHLPASAAARQPVAIATRMFSRGASAAIAVRARTTIRSPGVDRLQRQNAIVERVLHDGYVSVEDLAAAFSVTPQTIRRDIG